MEIFLHPFLATATIKMREISASGVIFARYADGYKFKAQQLFKMLYLLFNRNHVLSNHFHFVDRERVPK